MGGSYKIQIAEGWKWQYNFSYKWVRFARGDKAVALHEAHTLTTYVEVLPSSLPLDEYKHRPARMRYSNNFCTLRTQTDAAPMLWFADCQNSTTFKLAPPGMEGSLGLE